jgi:hypothetical protein
MPQSWDMGHIISPTLRRKAYCGFSEYYTNFNNKIKNWHFLSDTGSSAPKPKLGFGIVAQFEDEITGLLLGSGGLGGWVVWVGWNRDLIFHWSWNYRHVSPFCLSHHIYQHLHKILHISITRDQRSTVRCELLAQHFNKYVQLCSSASGRCLSDWALCLFWVGANRWFVFWSRHTVWNSL